MRFAIDFKRVRSLMSIDTKDVQALRGVFDKKSRRSFLRKLGFITLLIVLFYGIALHQIQVVLNATPSLPQNVFIFLKRRHPCSNIPSKDHFILFDQGEVGVRVVKQVKGLPGSILSYDAQGNLWVDDFCVGKPHASSHKGNPVTAIPAGVIPSNHVFAYGTHDHSFDSRYAEFGLISVSRIKGVGIGI